MAYFANPIIPELTMTKQAEFESIYEAYYPKVFRLCSGYASGRDDWAKETAQDVFITVWNKLETLNDQKALPAWIYRIAFNTCMKRLKERKHQAVLSDQLPDPAYSPEQQSEANEMIQKIHRALAHVSVDEKNLILLMLEGLENDDISDILGISRSHLRVKMHRTRQKLKTLLENERI
ncbi:MAG: sigma-70 family RNA polymerase sigma factor [Carboxylicivirga sp.]|jgi:RNA polymerase sigma-70 factor (ECF subfamily)|nr:sigma-70 family RNA polymerase sigma factor [Carboxylicivirga sp.]MCT4643845.1 sigma-70 family RNA polymerase sigma factor [Carboxylicivirga sp.]